MPEQTYKWFIRASDGTNTTDSSKQIVSVDVKTSAGKAALLASQPGVTSKGGATLSVASVTDKIPGGSTTIIIAVIVIVITLVIVKRK